MGSNGGVWGLHWGRDWTGFRCMRGACSLHLVPHPSLDGWQSIMVKHNNVVPNGHFHKQWWRNVRTWFDQPARKLRRRLARQKKIAAIAPRPLETYRPLVQSQTIRYNRKTREGRGFTVLELKKAGLSPLFARSIGISVDARRRNRSAEGLQKNVQRLEVYKNKINLIPRNPAKPKKGAVNDSVASK